jgi:hypothetical protein
MDKVDDRRTDMDRFARMLLGYRATGFLAGHHEPDAD